MATELGLKSNEQQDWVAVQQKTFTKWINSHLRKHGYSVENVKTDFKDGIALMKLVNTLYSTPIPKHTANPKQRVHMLDNVTLAIKMGENSGIKFNFLKPPHLVDEDLKMILGMIWAIILDYQIKGISVEELSAKEGLLLWCQKKTAGYRDVKVENFTSSWQDGLALCALIHHHRPDLLEFDPLNKADRHKNLQLAFDVAEKHLGIAKLLDVEDLADSVKPDERSVMTYISEFFHVFSAQNLKEIAARRVQKFVQFNRHMEELESEYETSARELLAWIDEKVNEFGDHSSADTLDEAKVKFQDFKTFLTVEKPRKTSTKLDLEASFVNIQTNLRTKGRVSYTPPSGLAPEDVDAAWARLSDVESKRSNAVRDNMFKFITSSKTEITKQQMDEFRQTFDHFDHNKNNALDKLEFRACLASLSIPFKSDQEYDKVFAQVSQGNPSINFEQFVAYLTEVVADKDTAESIKQAFKTLANGQDTVREVELRIPPLVDQEVAYLAEKMSKSGEAHDYVAYTDSAFRS
eukprot:Phypoly_transcript_06973.p1 GENE.Phypoly_transcript_06973~~Phypoly_transcript_06973.p1  ORF type:complete len:534 (+),score=118.90 Phypoly_transcript_06973:40-1602(+)